MHSEPNSPKNHNQPTAQCYSPGKGGNRIRLLSVVKAWVRLFHTDFRFQIGFLDFTWISGFHVDFRISKWISTFWILFEELLFVILNKPSQPGCTQNTISVFFRVFRRGEIPPPPPSFKFSPQTITKFVHWNVFHIFCLSCLRHLVIIYCCSKHFANESRFAHGRSKRQLSCSGELKVSL